MTDTAREIEFHVAGQPVPQGSKSAFVRNGRAVLTEGRSKAARENHAAWRQAVATAARDWQEAHGFPPVLDGPVVLELGLWLSKPASKPKWKWLPDTKPDLDKLVRTVLDALTGVVLSDDSRIVGMLVFEVYAVNRGPGATVRLTDAAGAERLGELEIRGALLRN